MTSLSGLPPPKQPRLSLLNPASLLLLLVKSPKSAAFPVDEIVKN